MVRFLCITKLNPCVDQLRGKEFFLEPCMHNITPSIIVNAMEPTTIEECGLLLLYFEAH
jgi:hypothetical protein